MVGDQTWPLEQPTSFIPLLFIHSEGNCAPGEVTAMDKLICAGNIGNVALGTGDNPAVKYTGSGSHEECQKILDTSKTTKEIKKILAPLEESKEAPLILIEGALELVNQCCSKRWLTSGVNNTCYRYMS